MADFSWTPTTPLSRALAAGRYGDESGPAGVSVVELAGFELFQVMARRGQAEAMGRIAKTRFGISAPHEPAAIMNGKTTLIWSGPGQFLALSSRNGNGSTFYDARNAFAGVASFCEQSDGRALLRISGPRARQALAKLCSLDLHANIFDEGAAAATSIDHTSVNLWRGADAADGAPVFFLLVFSTFAESLFSTLLDAAAEYGLEVGREAV